MESKAVFFDFVTHLANRREMGDGAQPYLLGRFGGNEKHLKLFGFQIFLGLKNYTDFLVAWKGFLYKTA